MNFCQICDNLIKIEKSINPLTNSIIYFYKCHNCQHQYCIQCNQLLLTNKTECLDCSLIKQEKVLNIQTNSQSINIKDFELKQIEKDSYLPINKTYPQLIDIIKCEDCKHPIIYYHKYTDDQNIITYIYQCSKCFKIQNNNSSHTISDSNENSNDEIIINQLIEDNIS